MGKLRFCLISVGVGLLFASPPSADTRCWAQPFVDGALIVGYRAEVAGIPILLTPISTDNGLTWCSEIPASGTYSMKLWVLWSGGEVEADNSGKVYDSRATACKMNVTETGAVSLADVSTVLSHLGEACE